MESSLKGTVVIIEFPFSDLSNTKRRPALIIADWKSNDVILCQITSIAHKDEFAVELTNDDFTSGSLLKQSFIRPNKIFTGDKRIFLSHAGFISSKKFKEVVYSIHNLISANF